jgi:hypothetical protein
MERSIYISCIAAKTVRSPCNLTRGGIEQENHMLDVIGAIFAGGLYATVLGVLIGLSPARAMNKLSMFAAAAAWLGIIIVVATTGGLAPGVLGPVPAIVLPFSGLLALLFAGWFLVPQFRNALLSLPLPALIGLNAARLGGVFFLLLYANGRLSAPFAQAAGLGDMATGALAIPLAAMLALGFPPHRAWLGIWNAFGALDLVVAVSLGVLSAPGTPFRVFIEEPGTLAMTTVPWVFVPTMFVPILLMIHFTIAAKLRSLPRSSHAVALAA